MAWIETHAQTDPTQHLREAITLAAAAGFLAGGLARIVIGSAATPTTLAALYLPLGAITAAIVAGIAVNLIALPTLIRILPGHRLPLGAYRAAGALSALAAFAFASTLV